MVRNLLNLYLTYSVVRCEVRCLSSAIADAYLQVLLEMERYGVLPAGATNLFHFKDLVPRNYTGKGDDRLTSTGLGKGYYGFPWLSSAPTALKRLTALPGRHQAPLLFGGRGFIVRHTGLFFGSTLSNRYVMSENPAVRKYGEHEQ
jgi:hypothetical protein